MITAVPEAVARDAMMNRVVMLSPVCFEGSLLFPFGLFLPLSGLTGVGSGVDSMYEQKSPEIIRALVVLYIEAEENDVAVLHDIFFSFASEKSFLLNRRHGTAGD